MCSLYAVMRSGSRVPAGQSYLLQPPPLLFLLLDAFLPLGQQLPLVLLVLLLLQLLTPDQLRALLVGQLQAQEVPPQRGLARNVDDGAGGGPISSQNQLNTWWYKY